MKKILISPIVKKNKYNEILFSVENNWYNFFKKQNVSLITLSPNIKFIEEDIRGVILQGGNDLPKFLNSKQNILRKRNDIMILKHALKNRIPVLAICYGFQLLAESYGSKIEKSKIMLEKVIY